MHETCDTVLAGYLLIFTSKLYTLLSSSVSRSPPRHILLDHHTFSHFNMNPTRMADPEFLLMVAARNRYAQHLFDKLQIARDITKNPLTTLEHVLLFAFEQLICAVTLSIFFYVRQPTFRHLMHFASSWTKFDAWLVCLWQAIISLLLLEAGMAWFTFALVYIGARIQFGAAKFVVRQVFWWAVTFGIVITPLATSLSRPVIRGIAALVGGLVGCVRYKGRLLRIKITIEYAEPSDGKETAFAVERTYGNGGTARYERHEDVLGTLTALVLQALEESGKTISTHGMRLVNGAQICELENTRNTDARYERKICQEIHCVCSFLVQWFMT